MAQKTSPRLGRLLAALALAGALAGTTAGSALAAYDPADPAQKAQYDQALSLGTQGYVYGVPLLDTERVFQTQTSVDACDDASNGPVNRFCPQRHLIDPANHTVVAPNYDTLYSNAWLDLRRKPLVLHVPDAGPRMNVVPLLDPWQENFANVGNGTTGLLAPGDYTITGPKDHGKKIPAGTTEIRSPYDRVWIIQRTYVNNADPADFPRAWAIQDATTLTPADRWGKHKPYVPDTPKHPDTTVDTATIPGTLPGENPLDFFNALNAEMEDFSPTAADQPLIDQLAAVGIAPGGKPVTKNQKLSDATLAGLSDAVAAGKAKVNTTLTQLFGAGFAAHNGYLVAPTGNYGTDYNFRAVVDQIGLGALPKNVALYPIAQTDRTGAPLDGANKRYVVHLNGPGNPTMPQLPIPADAFWSITMYDSAGFFVPNAIDRFLINDRSDLHYNADGSLDLYVQKDAPTDPDQRRNWLPAPAGNFRMIWRLYGTPADKIGGVIDGSGWKPGTVLPCTPSGSTPAFPASGITAPIACAS
jgi:hypothetical protein